MFSQRSILLPGLTSGHKGSEAQALTRAKVLLWIPATTSCSPDTSTMMLVSEVPFSPAPAEVTSTSSSALRDYYNQSKGLRLRFPASLAGLPQLGHNV